jgi:hypothetical protein
MSEYQKIAIGIAWYRPEQWSMLRALSSDPEVLERTHAEWLAGVAKTMEALRQQGISVKKIDIDVQELSAWCQSRDRVMDGDARATYVTEKMKA